MSQNGRSRKINHLYIHIAQAEAYRGRPRVKNIHVTPVSLDLHTSFAESLLEIESRLFVVEKELGNAALDHSKIRLGRSLMLQDAQEDIFSYH
jgi:hypothetical protein